MRHGNGRGAGKLLTDLRLPGTQNFLELIRTHYFLELFNELLSEPVPLPPHRISLPASSRILSTEIPPASQL